MKRLITLSILLCCLTSAGYSQSATTQSTQKGDTTKPVKWNENGKLIIGGGIGYGLFFFNGRGGYNDQLGFDNITPEFGGSVAYLFANGFSIEVAVAYQTEEFGYINGGSFNPWDSITRLNVSIGLIKHLNRRNAYFDNYIGVKVGCSYWTDSYTGPSEPNPWKIGAPHLYLASVQLFYGLTFYPGGGPVGINAEVGIGTPYIVQVGLVLRI